MKLSTRHYNKTHTSGMQLPIEKKKGEIFAGTTKVRGEAAETPQDTRPTMVP